MPLATKGSWDDTLVDGQRTQSGHAPLGKVPGSIEIGIQLQSTFPTVEPALASAIGAGNMAALRASLRRIASISKLHSDAPGFGFVRHEPLELDKGPVMQFPSLFAPGLKGMS